jgi:hypothetical protein
MEVRLYIHLRHKEVSGQLHAPADLTQSKEPRHTFVRRLGGPQSLSGRCGEEKNPALPGIKPRSPGSKPNRSPHSAW